MLFNLCIWHEIIAVIKPVNLTLSPHSNLLVSAFSKKYQPYNAALVATACAASEHTGPASLRLWTLDLHPPITYISLMHH